MNMTSPDHWGEREPSVSVVIPCFNEMKNLESGVLDEVRDHFEKQSYPWEVIIVDDESTDGSKGHVARFIRGKPGFRLFGIAHGGKPAAVREGIQHARGGIVLVIDMDQSTPIGEFDKLLPWFEKGFDVVIGSRGNMRDGFSPLRKIGSFIFLHFRRLFLLRNILDTQCGFKSFRRQIAEEIFPRLQFFKQTGRPSGWTVSAYDVELLFLIEKAGYRIKEIPIRWRNSDLSQSKNAKGDIAGYASESVKMAKEILRVKSNQIRGLYR